MSGAGSHVNNLFARNGGLHPPVEVIASWPKPNHIDPEERGWGAPIALVIVLAITFLVYSARIWARLVISKSAGLDGKVFSCTVLHQAGLSVLLAYVFNRRCYFIRHTSSRNGLTVIRTDLLISVAMVPLFSLTIVVVLAIRQYGFQWHVWDQTAETVITSRQVTLAIELNYLVSTTLIKVSILCFYRRITGSLKNSFVCWTWGSIIFCSVFGIVFTIAILTTCTPVVGFFHLHDTAWRAVNKLSCNNEGAIIVACAAISTIQDLVICMLPIFLIWNLHITRRQRLALCGIFGMGIITCICGILRTYYATYVYYYTYDITYYAYDGWVWTVLEVQLAVVSASAPALKVFFQRYFKMPNSRGGYSGTGSCRTPVMPSMRSRGHPLTSGLSTTRWSQIVGGAGHDADVPLGGIKVSQGLDVHVVERDDLSQSSFGSTRNLTALPYQGEPGWKSDWVEGCRTVRAALKPVSRETSRSRSRETDLERGV